jgi:hypothetical protein
MKRVLFIIPAMSLALIIGISADAFCLEPFPAPPQMPGASMAPMTCVGRMHPPLNPGIRLIYDCMQINVLAELTGLPQENIKQLLISSPPQAIIDAYGILPEAFVSAMNKQTTKLINQATLAGVITRKQADEIQKKLSMKPTGPCLR